MEVIRSVTFRYNFFEGSTQRILTVNHARKQDTTHHDKMAEQCNERNGVLSKFPHHYGPKHSWITQLDNVDIYVANIHNE